MNKSNLWFSIRKYKYKIYLPTIIFYCIILLLNSCSSLPLVPISYQIKSSTNLNSDDYESSLPVLVRIYQLSDIASFREATFRQLWKSDKQILGDSFVSVKSLTIPPGQNITIKQDRNNKTKYIGLLALFRHPELGRWRSYKQVSSQASSLLTSMNIYLTANSVSIK